MANRPNDRIAINQLQQLAYHYHDKLIDDTDIRKNDITDIFFQELATMVQQREPICININGPVGSSKSTTGIQIGIILGRYKNITITVDHIYRDQYEFMKAVKTKQLTHTVSIIDEYNEMEMTGENASHQQSFWEDYSSIHAQTFNDRVICSPASMPDKNSNIHLDIMATDKTKKITMAEVSFLYIKKGQRILQTIGHIRVDVSEALTKDWYQDYVKNKFDKMTLATKFGVTRVKDIDHAHIHLEVVDRLKDAAKLGPVDKDLISTMTEVVAWEHRMEYSMIADLQFVKRIYSILHLITKMSSIQNDISKLQKKYNNNPPPAAQRLIEINTVTFREWEDTYTKIIKHWQRLASANENPTQ